MRATGKEQAQSPSAYPRYIAFAVFAAFLLFFKFSFHELWKDEWQAWFIATDHDSLADLFSFLPYEGHPSLWFLLLRGGNAISNWLFPVVPKEYILQSIHFLIGAGALYIYLVKFDGRLWTRILLAAGYFTFFEYSVVNRGYILVVLLCYALAWVAKSRRNINIYTGLLLFLLCQTEVYGIFAASGFYTCLLLAHRQEKRFHYMVSAPFLLGILLFVATVYPADDMQLQTATLHQFELFNLERFALSFQSLFCDTLWSGIPGIDKTGLSPVKLLLSLGIFIMLIVLFRQDRKVLLAYLVFFLADLVFSSVVYSGGPRQWGIHLVFIIALLNLAEEPYDPKIKRLTHAFILVTGIFQLTYNIRIVGKDVRYPFSNSRSAGRYIRSNIPKDAVIIAVNKAYATPVIGYSGHQCYSLPEQVPFSYFLWKEKMYVPTMSDILELKALKSPADVYVLSYRELNLNAYIQLIPVMDFSQPNIREENYFLYKVR